ncbi:MAG: mevalonate 5-phosphate dehydratase small subunit [Thermococcaceae archaeon]|nr:mevalonate 5-phosphate dehydratase small subunit [Thermococcaceae archaeon]MDK2913758.1 mevalonate 5-phosphate dehydratase small subunit [Thermococcaceae archaeon]
MKLKGRKIVGGKAEGEVVVSEKPLSFLGGVDPETGIVTDAESDIKGQSVAGKILVFPRGKGSTVGSYVIYALKKSGKAPKAIIVGEAETIVATGAIIAGIPMVDKVDVSKLRTGMRVRVNADTGEVEVLEE